MLARAVNSSLTMVRRYLVRFLILLLVLALSLLALKRLEKFTLSVMIRTFPNKFPLLFAPVHQNMELWNQNLQITVQNETWGWLKTGIGDIDIMIYPIFMDKIVSLNLLVNGSWEPGEIAGVERLFRCDRELGLVDIGANIGLYVLLGAKYGRHVVAVEPSLDNMGRLYASVQRNNFQDRVTMIRNAVSNQYTTMQLTANPWNRGNTVIHDNRDPDFHVQGEYEVERRLNVGSVKTILMDDLVPVMRASRVLLKIDIEGAEKLAFQYSRDFLTLLDIPYIFMEWLWIRQDKDQAKHLYEYFTGLGYRPYANAYLSIALRDNYLHWPTDVFWVNVAKAGPCFEELYRWMDEGLSAGPPSERDLEFDRVMAEKRASATAGL